MSYLSRAFGTTVLEDDSDEFAYSPEDAAAQDDSEPICEFCHLISSGISLLRLCPGGFCPIGLCLGGISLLGSCPDGLFPEGLCSSKLFYCEWAFPFVLCPVGFSSVELCASGLKFVRLPINVNSNVTFTIIYVQGVSHSLTYLNSSTSSRDNADNSLERPLFTVIFWVIFDQSILCVPAQDKATNLFTTATDTVLSLVRTVLSPSDKVQNSSSDDHRLDDVVKLDVVTKNTSETEEKIQLNDTVLCTPHNRSVSHLLHSQAVQSSYFSWGFLPSPSYDTFS